MNIIRPAKSKPAEEHSFIDKENPNPINSADSELRKKVASFAEIVETITVEGEKDIERLATKEVADKVV